MKISEAMPKIQSELKAPKGQYNNFGKYKYRSCEDILEALKPILKKYDCYITLSDDLEVNSYGVYVKASAIITADDGTTATSIAYAKEAEHKGMSADQATGAASSYARKYALGGLLALDDSKDSDSIKPPEPQEVHAEEQPNAKQYFCDICGKPFIAFAKNGKYYTPGQAHHMAIAWGKKQGITDGKARCRDCLKKYAEGVGK